MKVFSLQPKISRAKDWNANAVHVVVEQRPSAGTNVDVGSAIDMVIGNLTPPPPAWRRVLGQVVTALPLAPWWMWLAIGVPLGAVGVGVIKRIVRQTPKPAPLAPSAECTLNATRVVAKTRVGPNGEPTVRFTLGLRDRGSVAQCRVDGEPAVRRRG